MKIVFISDTHRNNVPKLPPGDVLVHCGDWSSRGSIQELTEYCNYLRLWKPNYSNIITICGNHDWIGEKEHSITKSLIEETGAIYLNDSGCEIAGVKFWGSPITPEFCNWAFNRFPEEIGRHWEMIPDDTDVLITHGPPLDILDKTSDDRRTGCPELRRHIFERLKALKVHAFGHIHESYGVDVEKGITFINASLLNRQYRQVNRPIELVINNEN